MKPVYLLGIGCLAILSIVLFVMFQPGKEVRGRTAPAASEAEAEEAIQTAPVPQLSQPERESLATGEVSQPEVATPAPPVARLLSQEPQQKPFVVLRIFGPDGVPLVRESIGRTFFATGASGGSTQESSSEGTLRFPIPLRFRDQPNLALRLSWENAEEHVAAHAECLLPTPHVGEIDLGDVFLKPDQALVAGVVLDSAGAPIQGATVTLGWGASAPIENPTLAWGKNRIPASQASKKDGSFSFYSGGTTPLLDLMLSVDDRIQGYRSPEPLAVHGGDLDLQIVLSKGAVLRGRVHYPLPLAPMSVVSMALTKPGRPLEYEFTRSFGIPILGAQDLSMSYEFSTNETGVRDLVFFINHSEGDPILTIENIQIPEGGPVLDSRIESIDLTFLRPLKIDVVDQEGHELGGKIRVRRAGSDDWPRMSSSSADPDRPGIIAAFPVVDVQVSKRGYGSVVVEGVSTDQRVVLKKE